MEEEEVDYSGIDSGANTPQLPPQFECSAPVTAGLEDIDEAISTEINQFFERILATEKMIDTDIKDTAEELLKKSASWMSSFRRQLMNIIVDGPKVKYMMSLMYIINCIMVRQPGAGAKQHKHYREEGKAFQINDTEASCLNGTDDAPSWYDIVIEALTYLKGIIKSSKDAKHLSRLARIWYNGRLLPRDFCATWQAEWEDLEIKLQNEDDSLDKSKRRDVMMNTKAMSSNKNDVVVGSTDGQISIIAAMCSFQCKIMEQFLLHCRRPSDRSKVLCLKYCSFWLLHMYSKDIVNEDAYAALSIACVFLAGKVEYNFVKVDRLRSVGNLHVKAGLGEDRINENDQVYYYERQLLKMLGYNIGEVINPLRYLNNIEHIAPGLDPEIVHAAMDYFSNEEYMKSGDQILHESAEWMCWAFILDEVVIRNSSNSKPREDRTARHALKYFFDDIIVNKIIDHDFRKYLKRIVTKSTERSKQQLMVSYKTYVLTKDLASKSIPNQSIIPAVEPMRNMYHDDKYYTYTSTPSSTYQAPVQQQQGYSFHNERGYVQHHHSNDSNECYNEGYQYPQLSEHHNDTHWPNRNNSEYNYDSYHHDHNNVEHYENRSYESQQNYYDHHHHQNDHLYRPFDYTETTDHAAIGSYTDIERDRYYQSYLKHDTIGTTEDYYKERQIRNNESIPSSRYISRDDHLPPRHNRSPTRRRTRDGNDTEYRRRSNRDVAYKSGDASNGPENRLRAYVQNLHMTRREKGICQIPKEHVEDKVSATSMLTVDSINQRNNEDTSRKRDRSNSYDHHDVDINRSKRHNIVKDCDNHEAL